MVSFKLLFHSSIVLDNNIYIDPFKIKEAKHDAKIVFITHSHYDHFSLEDIEKVSNDRTILILPESCKEVAKGLNNVVFVTPNNEYEIEGVKFKTIRAYNVNKKFHPYENNWLGYLIMIKNTKFFIMGDTDMNEDNLKVTCDVLFIPIGSVYTMDYLEASKYTNLTKPKIVVPTHYGSIVGTSKDLENFKARLDKDIQCESFL